MPVGTGSQPLVSGLALAPSQAGTSSGLTRSGTKKVLISRSCCASTANGLDSASGGTPAASNWGWPSGLHARS
jgi:hypothetical protein